MKTSTKVWLGIAGYLGGQALGASMLNTIQYSMIEKFNTKLGEVRDLLESKKDEITEDKYDNYYSRINQAKREVENCFESKTIFLTVGAIRLGIFKRRVRDSIASLRRIEDEINGLVIDAEVKTS